MITKKIMNTKLKIFEKSHESSTELPEAVPIESDKKDETATDTQADTELIAKLLSNPETAALLKALASKL